MPHAAIVYGIVKLVMVIIVEVGPGVIVVVIAAVIQTEVVAAAAGGKWKGAVVAASVAVGQFPVGCNSIPKLNVPEARSKISYLLQSRLLFAQALAYLLVQRRLDEIFRYKCISKALPLPLAQDITRYSFEAC